MTLHNGFTKSGLGTAMLKSRAGQFLLPPAQTVSDAASVLDPCMPPDERLSLAFLPAAGSHPLVNCEYAVVSTHQPDPATAAAVRHFLLRAIAIDGGNGPKYVDAVQFVPPPHFISLAEREQEQFD